MSFDVFMNVLKSQLGELAKETVVEVADSAVQTGLGFVENLKADVSCWLEELKTGELSLEDFEDLLRGEQDVMNVTLLTEMGLAASRVEQFQNAIIGCVVSAAKAAS